MGRKKGGKNKPKIAVAAVQVPESSPSEADVPKEEVDKVVAEKNMNATATKTE